MSVWAVIVAAGKGSRMGGDTNKVFMFLGGMSVLERTVMAFARHERVDGICVVASPGERELCERTVSRFKRDRPVIIADGGETRQQSVLSGIRAVAERADFVLIHDGARPLVDRETISRVIDDTEKTGACVPVLAIADTIRRILGDKTEQIDRNGLHLVQTPQGFAIEIALRSLEMAEADGVQVTDDAAAADYAGYKVATTMGDRFNIKLTTPEDMSLAESLLSESTLMQYTGIGTDIHRLAEGRRLVLCGVDIPYECGLLGHSDADCALHAVIDAVLGAAALGDIGAWFPDTDERFKGADSADLVRHTINALRLKGYMPVSIDLTITAQRPKLAPFRDEMRERLCELTGCAHVNVKFKTAEGLGAEGACEAISAIAIAALRYTGKVLL